MIARWFYDLDPIFNNYNRLSDILDRVIDEGMPLANIRSVPRGSFPPINFYERKDGVQVQAYVPGIDPKKIEVTFHNNSLAIKGERDTFSQGSFHRKERFSGAFNRIVSLPEGLDPEKVKAQYKEGVLLVTIDKMEQTKPKQIDVKIE
jgi:HSP20 family protein